MRYFILIFSLIVFHWACTDECKNENVFLGNIEYDLSTLEHIQYEAGQMIQFQDKNGFIKEFLVTKEEAGQAILCVKVTCRPAFELDGDNACEYYHVPSDYFVLKSSDVWLHFKSGIELYEAETENHYEFVEIGLTNDEANIFAGTITAQNFSPTIITTTKTILTNLLNFGVSGASGTEPGSNRFEKSLSYSNPEGSLYIALQQDLGIVQFAVDGQLWTLVQ